MTVELTGALQAAFWAVDCMGAVTAWRATGDAVQTPTARFKGRRKADRPQSRFLLQLPEGGNQLR